jgi:hypothetical protein
VTIVSHLCAVWAIVQNFVMCYGPQCRILLCAMGHSEEFCSVLWATAQNFFFYEPWSTAHNFLKRYGPWCRIVDHSGESHELHSKACRNLSGNSQAKKLYIYFMHYPRPSPSMLKSLLNFNKSSLAQNEIWIGIFWQGQSLF